MTAESHTTAHFKILKETTRGLVHLKSSSMEVTRSDASKPSLWRYARIGYLDHFEKTLHIVGLIDLK